jgi:alpha-galactosidase
MLIVLFTMAGTFGGVPLSRLSLGAGWTVVPRYNAVRAGTASTQPTLAACEGAAAGAAQFSWNERSGHCFSTNATQWGGAPSAHVTSGCVAARVPACGAAPPPPSPPPPRSKDFPPGWNGLARTPPMGWRSWNAFGATPLQSDLDDMVRLIATPGAFDAATSTRSSTPSPSLAALGYSDVGIDEGWEGCGEGVNGTQHAASGDPIVHAPSFPDLGAWVASAHAAGLTAGWYLNGCACGEPEELAANYEGDVRTALALGFDGVKFDGCGAQNNHSLYARLFNASAAVGGQDEGGGGGGGGGGVVIENCHAGDCTGDDDSGCGSLDWCPFSLFRASRDIDATDTRWFLNLQSAVRFLDRAAPVSQPGCWAYGDMLEVGRLSTFELSRAHFSAFAIISSPLVLSLDLRDAAAVAAVWPIIANEEVISINQRWAGHPGWLAKQWDPPPSAPAPAPAPALPLFAALLQAPDQPCNASDPAQAGWSYDGSAGAVRFESGGGGGGGGAVAALCLDSALSAGHLVLAPCDAASATQRFECRSSDGQPCLLRQNTTTTSSSSSSSSSSGGSGGGSACVTVEDWSANNVFLAPCKGLRERSAQLFSFGADGSDGSDGKGLLSSVHTDFWRAGEVRKCITTTPEPTFPDPAGEPEKKASRAKPLQLWVKPQPNGSMAILLLNMLRGVRVRLSVDFAADLNLSAPCAVRDVWEHSDAPGTASTLQVEVPGYDSRMYLLTPQPQGP